MHPDTLVDQPWKLPESKRMLRPVSDEPTAPATTVNLSPMATDALASIRSNDPEATTDTVVIERAILAAWVKLRNRKAKK